ncbi:MAG: pyridoxal 5'-phosphate synthase glutaminase subunit PdxT [Candidatus Rokuibacteriota bacterium]
MKIGVLALQGDFARHEQALRRCGRRASGGPSAGEASGEILDLDTVQVRKPDQLDEVDGLVIPGGESTTLLKLMEAWGFVPALEKFHGAGRPIFGTCAGVIVLAREVERPRQFSLGFIDLTVERNAYGRQRESFESAGEVLLDGVPRPVEMVFIRAPRIRSVGPDVETLARHRGEVVLVRQGTVLAATFHPELTGDLAVHRYFCEMVRRGAGVPETAR